MGQNFLFSAIVLANRRKASSLISVRGHKSVTFFALLVTSRGRLYIFGTVWVGDALFCPGPYLGG